MTNHEWIKAAAENDQELLLDGIKRLFNCGEADVNAYGDVWIRFPQSGHWLNEHDLARVARALEAGDL